MAPFRLDRVNFSDFDLVFRDAVMGIDSRLKLGKLNLRIKEMNLEEMQFHIANAEIKNSDIYYLQTLAFPESEDREDSAMPRLIVDNFEIVNVTADYQSITDGLAVTADIGDLRVKLPKADLTDNTIDLEYLGLHNSNISLKMTSQTENLQEEVIENTGVTDTVTSFTWPDWVVDANEIAISNINFEYSVDGAQPIAGTFNANALTLQDFNFEAKGVYLKEQSLGLNLETFSFKEASGIKLEALAMDIKFNEKNTTIENLDVRINENKISGELFLQHESIDALINRPENLIVKADFPGFELSLKDIFRFQPQLRQNEYMRALSRKKISGNLKINGTLAALEIPSSTIRWGNNTRVTMRGTVFNVTDSDNMRFDFPQLNIISTRFDLLNFVKEEDLGISIPKDISIAASFSGDVEDVNATALVKTTNGDISIKGNYFNKNELAFEVDLDVMQLQLDKLLNNDRFGEISLTLTSSGRGNNVNDLDAVFETNISRLQLQNYAIEDLSITGDIENGQGFINSSYKDENIDVVLETLVQLDSVSPRFLVDLNLKGADLYALGLTNKNVRGGMVLRADFKGNADDFEMEATIIDGIAIYNEQTYLLGNVDMYAFVESDTTSVVVFNRMVQLDMHSNTNPTEFTKALQRHLDTYFSENVYVAREDTLVTPVELYLKTRISNAPILRDIFLPGLQELDTVKINVDFQERIRNLTADVRLPHINYNGNV
ncbi:MAG: translocation/assembly module TamB, partial [Flavobacteriales bacterium]|nr:translocation/assembly module TamB [Flavobacteriales bacterium]